MMGTLVLDKEKIQQMLVDFPKSVVIDDFIDKIIITAKLEQALDQFEKGQYITSEELDKEIEKWG